MIPNSSSLSFQNNFHWNTQFLFFVKYSKQQAFHEIALYFPELLKKQYHGTHSLAGTDYYNSKF